MPRQQSTLTSSTCLCLPPQRHGLYLSDLRPNDLAAELVMLGEGHAADVEEMGAMLDLMEQERDEALQESVRQVGFCVPVQGFRV